MELEGSLLHSYYLYVYLSWVTPIQSTTPHTISIRSILMLSTYLCLILPGGLFPSSFPINNLYAVFFSPIHTTFPAHIILLDLIILIILGDSTNHQLISSFLHPPVTSSLFGWNHVSCPYKINRIVDLYICMFNFFDKSFWYVWQQMFSKFNVFLILYECCFTASLTDFYKKINVNKNVLLSYLHPHVQGSFKSVILLTGKATPRETILVVIENGA
jgi:hypothetical protein